MSEMTLPELSERLIKIDGAIHIGAKFNSKFQWSIIVNGLYVYTAETIQRALELAENGKKFKYKFEGVGWYAMRELTSGRAYIGYCPPDGPTRYTEIIGPRINFDEETGEIK